MIIVCPKVGLSKGEGGDGQASGSGDLKERLGAAGPPLPFTAKDIDMQIQRQNRHPSARLPIPITRLLSGAAARKMMPPFRYNGLSF